MTEQLGKVREKNNTDQILFKTLTVFNISKLRCRPVFNSFQSLVPVSSGKRVQS